MTRRFLPGQRMIAVLTLGIAACACSPRTAVEAAANIGATSDATSPELDVASETALLDALAAVP